MKKNFLYNKRVGVLGAGVSGVAVARYALQHASSVFVSEARDTDAVRKEFRHLERNGARVELGKHSIAQLSRCDLVVVSPGISPRSRVIRALKNRSVRLMSEIELGARVCPGHIISVTGTNGKSTVTTLISNMLERAGLSVVACGNLGTPFVSCVTDDAERYYVVEVSSFQLFYSRRFHPEVAVLLNVTPDHLDWHRSMREYAQSKMKPFRAQTKNDHAVYHSSCRVLIRGMKVSLRAKKHLFSAKRYRTENENFAAVYAVAQAVGVAPGIAEKTCHVFPGLPHRVEYVCSRRGVRYVNDSKATTPDSIVWALKLCDSPVVLICGGKNKGLAFSCIRSHVKKQVKGIVTIGEAAETIATDLEGVATIIRAHTLKDAVLKARSVATRGDTVLLSPGCASFDMFINYKDRGDQFKECARDV